MQLVLTDAEQKELHALYAQLSADNAKSSISIKYLDVSLLSADIRMMRAYARMSADGMGIQDIYTTVNMLKDMGVEDHHEQASFFHFKIRRDLLDALTGRDGKVDSRVYKNLLLTALSFPEKIETIVDIFSNRNIWKGEEIVGILQEMHNSKPLRAGAL